MWKRVLFCLVVAATGLTTASPMLAAEPAADAGAGLNPFSPSVLERDLALWTAVIFLCVLAVLWKYAWGPLAAALDKRERGIADQISEAEAANEKAKGVLADYQQRLADAKDEVRGILEQGRRDSEKLGRELLDKAKEEASVEHARGVEGDRGRRRRRGAKPRRPQRRDGGRVGRQDRPRQPQRRRPRPVD